MTTRPLFPQKSFLPAKPAGAQHNCADMSDLYARYPYLQQVEQEIDHRFERRRPILTQVPRWKVGAELGVFTGSFSEFIIEITKPSRFYLVDPWWKVFGERFQDWGAYTANGKLETRAAYEAAALRASRWKNCHVVVERSSEWLAGLPDEHLDWVYLDSTHQYRDTLDELRLIAPKLNPDGIILGDDCWARRDNKHYGVFRAVRDFCREFGFEIVQMDTAGQWAARKTID